MLSPDDLLFFQPDNVLETAVSFNFISQFSFQIVSRFVDLMQLVDSVVISGLQQFVLVSQFRMMNLKRAQL